MATIDPLTGLPSSNTQLPNGTVVPSPTIDATKLGTTNAIVVPPPTTIPVSTYTTPVIDTSSYLQSLADAQAAQQEYQNKLSLAQSTATDLSQAQSALGMKGQDTANAYDVTGANAAVARIRQLNAQAVGLQNEAQAIPIQNAQNYQGTAGTQSGVQSVNHDQLSQNALKALSLGQQAALAQADYATAKDKADQIVNMKYAQLEADIVSRKTQLESLNQYVLTPAQEKAKNAQVATIKKQEEIIAEKKANDKAIADLMINAAQVAPPDVLSRAKAIQDKGGSPTQVAMALGQYGKDYLANEKLKLDMQKVKADIAKTNLESSKIRGEINAQNINNPPIPGAGSNAEAWLAQYNSGALSLEDIYTKIGSTKEAGVLKNQVAQLVAAQGGKRVYGKDDASIQAINSQIKNIDDLLNGDVGTIVGLVQGGLGILPDKANIYKQDALAIAKNLISNQTLQALADAKSKGVTFGALSEAELKAVADSASRISAKIKTDDKGNITGFTGSEEQFKKDLQAVKEGLQKSIINKTKSVGTSFVSTGNPVADSFIQKSMGVLQSANTSTPATMGGFIDNQK